MSCNITEWARVAHSAVCLKKRQDLTEGCSIKSAICVNCKLISNKDVTPMKIGFM